MDPAVHDLVASLRRADSVGPQWEVIDQWAREGDLEQLKQTAAALAHPPPTGVTRSAAQSVSERIARVLALTPRPEFAGAVCEIARLGDARRLASLAASGHDAKACAELVAHCGEEDQEFLACLIQEFVLRVRTVDQEPFTSFWRLIQSRGHPLGRLPLRLTGVETSLSLPSYTFDGSAFSGPHLRDELAGDEAGIRAVAPLKSETTESREAEHITSVVATWLEESNGRAEVLVFGLQVQQPQQPLGAVLADMGLECLGGHEPSRIDRISPNYAFNALFSASSNGGAYDRGSFGAYGRLNAWRAVTALIGAGPQEDIGRVEDFAERASWFRFDTDSGWFYDVAWDIGLAVLSAKETRLAVLAATDTD